MWYIALFVVILVCLVIIIYIFNKHRGKPIASAVKEEVKEKQAEIKKRLIESKLEKRLINFGESIVGVVRNIGRRKEGKTPIRKLTLLTGQAKGMKARLITKKSAWGGFFKKADKMEDDHMADERKLRGNLLEAQADLKKREIDKAEDEFIEILQKEPKNIEAYMGLGKIYVVRKEWQMAEEAYRHIVKINRKFFDGYKELLNIFEMSKKWDELKKVGQEILDLGHEQAWVYEKLGFAFKKTGYPDRAEEYFEKAVGLEPQNERLLDELMEVAIINKNKSLAGKAFNTLCGICRNEMKLQSYRDKIDIL